MISRKLNLVRVPAMALLILALVYSALLLYSATVLRRAYADLEAAGRPMTLDDLVPPPVPDTDNGALLLESAIARLRTEQVGTTNLFGYAASLLQDLSADHPLGTNTLAQAYAVFQRPTVIQALDQVREAREKGAYRADINYEDGPGALLPHLAPMRSLSRCLAAKARVETRLGHMSDAWDTLETGLALANSLQQEPILVSQLVRLAQVGVMCRAMEPLLCVDTPSDERGAEIIAELLHFEDRQAFVAAIDMERIGLGEWCFRRRPTELRNLARELGGWEGLSVLAFFTPLRQADHASYLRLLSKLAEASAQPFHRLDFRTLEKEAHDIPEYFVFTRVLVPAIPACRKREALGLAHARLARLGLALSQYRAEHGSYPATLQTLAGTLEGPLPRDPMTGNAFLYRREGDGYVLYSVGANLKDDGGQDRREENGRQPLDLVWQCPRP